MEAESRAIDAEELLRHSGWIRALALSLLQDAGLAEDAVQETFLAALRRPPRADGPLQPWLARVARNAALAVRRGGARRRAREEAVASAEASIDAPDQLVGELEEQAALARLVSELREPFRSTVVMRYYRGWTAAEIARRNGVPAGTVRWRLKSALDQLRDALDEQHGGDRRAWVALLAPLARGGRFARRGIASSLFTGGTMMGLLAKAGTAALFVVLALWILGELAGEGTDASPTLVERSKEQVASIADSGEPPELVRAARETEGATEVQRSVVAPEAPSIAAKARLARLRARFLDAAGRPVPEVELTGSLYGYSESGRSDSNGRVELSTSLLPGPLDIELLAVAPDASSWRGSAVVGPGDSIDLGDLVLSPAASISGKIVDVEGRALRRAQVSVHGPLVSEDAMEALWTGPTDRALAHEESGFFGGFELKGVRPGSVRVWARMGVGPWGRSERLELVPGQALEGVRIVLPSPASIPRIRGVVLSEAGEPVPQAAVWYRSPDGGGASTVGNDGSFELPPTVTRLDELYARDCSGFRGERLLRDLVASEDAIEVHLEPSEHGRILVIGRDGALVERFTASVSGAFEDVWSFTTTGASNEAGVAEIALPRASFRIEVDARGFELARVGPFDSAGFPSPLEVRLVPLPGITGRVVAADKPVQGARVTLLELADDEELVRHSGFPSFVQPLGQDDVETSADGTFRLFTRDAGRFLVQAEHAGFARGRSDAFEHAPIRGREDLLVELTLAGSIEGEVLPPPGGSAAGRVIAATDGYGEAVTMRTSSDGKFRFDGLAPGQWYVHATDVEVSGSNWSIMSSPWPGGWEHPFNCEVFTGRTTRFDIEPAPPAVSVLNGSLLLDGAPCVDWRVSLRRIPAKDPFAGPRYLETLTDAAGRFTFAVKDAGELVLAAIDSGARSGGLEIHDRVRVEPGTQEWNLDLPTAALLGSSADADVPLAYVWKGEGELRARVAIPRDPSGAFLLPRIPAGKGRIVTADGRKPEEDFSKLAALEEIEVFAGSVGRVELR